MSRPIVVLVTVGMLLLAGCSGGGATVTEPTTTDSTATNTPADVTATATPASTPTDSSSTPTGDVDFAPGTSADGITNTSALFAAHLEALNGSAYRVEASQNTSNMSADILIAEDDEHLRISTTASGTAAAGTDVWSASNRSITRREAGGSVSYSVAGEETPMGGFTTGLTDLYVMSSLAGIEYGEFNYSGTVERDGQQLLRFEATSANETAIESTNASITAYEGTVLVSERGVVHEATIDATQEQDGESQAVHTTYDTTLGVEPTAPSWLSEVPEISVSLTENGSLLAVEHTGGPAVENASVSLGMFGPRGTIEGSFEAGETRYLGVNAESGEIVVATERPDTADLRQINASTTFRLMTESLQVSLLAGGEA